MAAAKKKELTVSEKLENLENLQAIHSQIDKLRIIRGELPLEVEDLEDEVAGLQTRLDKLNGEVEVVEEDINSKKNAITDSKALISKYTEQQNNVRNNREFDSLNKEIEFQNLEIQLAEKRIKEYTAKIENKKEVIAETQGRFDDRQKHLEAKKAELEAIISETEKDEDTLNKKAEKASNKIEERLLIAYQRIREGARNGLAVVGIERDSCGGCFNKIPPQRQLDIQAQKKIIVCEHCGRVLVDKDKVVEEA